jgi:outer membrane protein assembly factor BamB
LSTAPKKPRWWLAGVFTGAFLAALGVARFWPQLEGLTRTLVALPAALVWFLLMLLWLVALSRLPWRARLGGLALVATGIVAFVALFRYAGVTGDLRPLFEPRWSRVAQAEPTPTPPARSLAPAASTASEPAPAVELSEPAPGAVAAEGETGSAATTADVTADAEAPASGSPLPAPTLAEFPQFLGPRRDGHVAVALEPDWAAHPPRELWRRPLGAAWSGFAISAGRAVTLERRDGGKGEDRDGQDWVRAYDLATGTALWELLLGGSFSNAVIGHGPRATPAIDQGVVFAFSSLGALAAAELESGRLLWSRDAAAEAGASPPEFGYAGSPLVLGDRVIVKPGGADGLLVAYDRATGEPVARGGSGAAAYSSVLLTELAGSPLLVSLNIDSLTGHDPDTLEERFRHPWPSPQNVAQPLPLGGDRLLLSAGYGVGAEAIRLVAAGDRLAVESLWKSPRLKAKFTNVVLHEGLVYGLDDGVLVCLDPETGERRWRQGRYGHGQVLLAGDLLLVQTEDGEVVLVEPDPAGLRELGRHEALAGKAWNSPALAPPVLLVRNDREAVALELALRGSSGT